jgi:hypothetical protein
MLIRRKIVEMPAAAIPGSQIIEDAREAGRQMGLRVRRNIASGRFTVSGRILREDVLATREAFAIRINEIASRKLENGKR